MIKNTDKTYAQGQLDAGVSYKTMETVLAMIPDDLADTLVRIEPFNPECTEVLGVYQGMVSWQVNSRYGLHDKVIQHILAATENKIVLNMRDEVAITKMWLFYTLESLPGIGVKDFH